MERNISNYILPTNLSVVYSPTGPTTSTGLNVSVILQVAAYCCVFLVSLIGNSLVIAILAKNVHGIRRVPMNTSLLHLAIADLMATVIGIPAMVARILLHNKWPIPGIFGILVCKIHAFLIEVSFAVAALNICIIALERFLALFCPISKTLTIKRAGILSIVLWLVVLALYAPKLYVTTVLQVSNNTAYCFAPRTSLVLIDPWRQIEGAFFVALFLITLIFYVSIIIKTQLRKMVDRSVISEASQRLRNEMHRRVLRQGLAVITVHYLCWLPFLCVYLLCLFYDRKLSLCKTNIFTSFVIFFLGYCNGAVNPLLYTATNETFRKCFKSIFNRHLHEESRVRPVSSRLQDHSLPNGESLGNDTPQSTRPQRYRQVEDNQSLEKDGKTPGKIKVDLPSALKVFETEDKMEMNNQIMLEAKWREEDVNCYIERPEDSQERQPKWKALFDRKRQGVCSELP